MSETQDNPQAGQRYELTELFPEEAGENLHFLQVAGQVGLVALMIIAFVFVFSQLSK
jgi:hypothetical protein